MFSKPLYDPFDDCVVEPQTPPVVPCDAGAPMGKASQGLVFAVALGVILVFAAFIAGMYVAQNRTMGDAADAIVADVETQDDVDVADASDTDNDALPVGDRTLNVRWLSSAEQVRQPMRDDVKSVLYAEYEDLSDWQAWSLPLGTIEGGAYDGYRLTMQYAEHEGLGTVYIYLYLLENPSNKTPDVLVGNYASAVMSVFSRLSLSTTVENVIGSNVDLFSELDAPIVIDSDVIVPEFEHEARVVDEKGNAFRLVGLFTRADFPEVFPVGSYADKTKLVDGPELYLYASDSNAPGFSGPWVGLQQFYRVREDGRLVWYDLEIPFFAYDKTNEYDLLSRGVPRLLWEGSKVNEAMYSKAKVGGCGVTELMNVVDDETVEELNLVYVADTLNAHERVDASSLRVYTPQNLSHGLLPQTRYDVERGEMVPVTEVSGGYPFVLFEDSFGRWVLLTHTEIVPAAECGKPVIYLYPEKEMDVTVRVEPQGGFSFTEPEYKDGWRVTAYPNGRLVNLDDGAEYPYLFWEGRGGLYAEPERYWVVAQSDVHDFLVNTLGQMGLNERETADFVEFWEPRMQSAPFYKIGFHGTDVMDELAPLSLSVKPDSVFRVLMDYEELEKPIEQNPPLHIPHFERRGFSVLEWGGVIR